MLIFLINHLYYCMLSKNYITLYYYFMKTESNLNVYSIEDYLYSVYYSHV